MHTISNTVTQTDPIAPTLRPRASIKGNDPTPTGYNSSFHTKIHLPNIKPQDTILLLSGMGTQHKLLIDSSANPIYIGHQFRHRVSSNCSTKTNDISLRLAQLYSTYQNAFYIYQKTLPGDHTHLTDRMKKEELNSIVLNNIHICLYVAIYVNAEMYHILLFVTLSKLMCYFTVIMCYLNLRVNICDLI